MRRQIKQTYIDFCQHTSIHGFKRTIDEENDISKMFWVLVLITSLIAATYISVLLWFRFVGNPITTTIKTIYAPIADVAFPGVTICPHPGIIPHKLDSFLDSLDLNGTDVTPQQIKESIDVVLALVSDLYHTYATNQSYEWMKRVFERNGYSAFQVFEELTMSCEESLLKCEFEGKLLACDEIFREVYTEAGRCCAFNSFLS